MRPLTTLLLLALSVSLVSSARALEPVGAQISIEVAVYRRLVELGELPIDLKIAISNPEQRTPAFDDTQRLRKQLTDIFPSLRPGTVRNWATKLGDEGALTRALVEQEDWLYLSVGGLAALQRGSGLEANFHRVFPTAGALLFMGRVGVDPTGTQAVLSITRMVPLGTTLYFLERRGRTWELVKTHKYATDKAATPAAEDTTPAPEPATSPSATPEPTPDVEPSAEPEATPESSPSVGENTPSPDEGAPETSPTPPDQP